MNKVFKSRPKRSKGTTPWLLLGIIAALIALNIEFRYSEAPRLLHRVGVPTLPEVFSLGSGSTSAQLISGRALIIDGDTIEINGTRIRLYGIDAPEMSQKCRLGQSDVACGREAAQALANQIGSQDVSCDRRDIDRYGRVVGVCSAAGTDLNGWMVQRGYAVAYRQYSLDYVTAEVEASRNKAGLWQYDFEMPWNFRQHYSSEPRRTIPKARWVSPPNNPDETPRDPGWVTPPRR